MVTFQKGRGVLCETHGQENFGVVEMIDGDGNAPPRGTIECVKVWFMDTRGQFKMEIRREDFWFRNGILCGKFCNDNNVGA